MNFFFIFLGLFYAANCLDLKDQSVKPIADPLIQPNPNTQVVQHQMQTCQTFISAKFERLLMLMLIAFSTLVSSESVALPIFKSGPWNSDKRKHQQYIIKDQSVFDVLSRSKHLVDLGRDGCHSSDNACYKEMNGLDQDLNQAHESIALYENDQINENQTEGQVVQKKRLSPGSHAIAGAIGGMIRYFFFHIPYYS